MYKIYYFERKKGKKGVREGRREGEMKEGLGKGKG